MEHDEGLPLQPEGGPGDRDGTDRATDPRPAGASRPAEGAAVDAPAQDATGAVMDLLAEHVPLTLLADLAVAEPRSEAILRAEGLPDDAWWVEADDAAGDSPQRTAGAAGVPAPCGEDELPVDPDAAGEPVPHGPLPA